MANEKKSSKINIISNEKITNFSDYLKASNLTSKKEILFKGLSNNVTLKNKFNLNNTPKKIIKKEINSSSSDEEANVLKSVKVLVYNILYVSSINFIIFFCRM